MSFLFVRDYCYFFVIVAGRMSVASKRNRKTPAWMESYVCGEQLASGSVRSDSTTRKLLKAELEAQRPMAEMEEAARQERLTAEEALVETLWI